MSTIYLQVDSFVGKERYRVARVIGRGGFGAVYLVEDTECDDNLFALKELLNKFKDPDELEAVKHMFNQEAGLLSRLNHPAIPRITDFFVEKDRLYVVMEYVEGKTLADHIDLKILPRENDVIEFALQMADVLSYLHSQKPDPVVFRDVKPENIMVGYDRRIYLIDFGLARLFDSAKKQDTIICLSQGYAPPEQYPAESGIPGAQGKTDPRSDIYALGATLHHLTTGRDPRARPFYFPSVRDLNNSVSEDLDEIILRCVEYDQEKRYQDVDGISRDLLKIIKKQSFLSRKEDMYSVGLRYEEEKNYEEALFIYKELLELTPEDGLVHYRIGKCYENMGLPDMSRKYLDNYSEFEARREKPLCPYCGQELAEKIASCFNCKNKIKICLKCRMLNREAALFCRICGGQKFDVIRHIESKYKPVTLRLNIKLYKYAIKKNPEEGDYYLGLGETYDAMDKPRKALMSYEKYLSIVKNGNKRDVVAGRVEEIKKSQDATMVDSRDWLTDSEVF